MKRLLPALLLLAFGCDEPKQHGVPDLSFVRMDLSSVPDLSMPASGSMSVTGDATSGYSPAATLTTFNCVVDPSFGATVSSTVPNNFPAGSSEAGDTLTLQIFNTGMWVVGGPPLGNIYYQKNGLTNDASAQTGTINNVVLDGGGASQPGTLTINGSWSCP